MKAIDFSVSVIIPTFKRYETLLLALQSVYKQTFQPSEIIVVNNNKIILENKNIQVNKNQRVKIVNCVKNFGSANGRNIGSSLSTKNFLAFLDDDDTWDQNYLKCAHKVYIEQRNLVIISDVYDSLYKKKHRLLKSIKNINNLKVQDCLIRNPGFMGSNVIINKNLLVKIGGWDGDLVPAEDRGLLIDLLLNKIKMSSSNGKVFYLYSKNRKNLSNNLLMIIKGHNNLLNKYKENISFAEKNYILFKINLSKYKISSRIKKLLYFLLSVIYLILFKIFHKY